jgi:NAD(P)-dependent dehydrogenase (short-subunit alcohol dehydrogenase family)
MRILDGKIAIVTGAGQGIGWGVALALAKEGAGIIVVDIQGENATRNANKLKAIGSRALGISCDVSRHEQVEAVVAATVREFKTVNILVNAAQDMHGDKPLENWTDDDFTQSLGSGLWGTFYFMRACFPYMKEHGGKIINFASSAGLQGDNGWAGYAAAKEGIRALTRVACHEWGKYKINVNVVCPMAQGKGWEPLVKDHPEIMQTVLAGIPLGRLGDPEKDIGRVVVFLASSDSDYITGHTIMADGGHTMLR